MIRWGIVANTYDAWDGSQTWRHGVASSEGVHRANQFIVLKIQEKKPQKKGEKKDDIPRI